MKPLPEIFAYWAMDGHYYVVYYHPGCKASCSVWMVPRE